MANLQISQERYEEFATKNYAKYADHKRSTCCFCVLNLLMFLFTHDRWWDKDRG